MLCIHPPNNQTKPSPQQCLEATCGRHRATNNSTASLCVVYACVCKCVHSRSVTCLATEICSLVYYAILVSVCGVYVCTLVGMRIIYNFHSSAYHCSLLPGFKFICARNDIFRLGCCQT